MWPAGSRGCCCFLCFQEAEGRCRFLLLDEPPPRPAGQVQQAHVQLPGSESLASPGETPAPFGKTPRAVFLSLLSSMRAEEAAGFHP